MTKVTGSQITYPGFPSYIIEQTLGRACEEIAGTLRREVAEATEAGRDAGELEQDFANRVLRLNVLD